MIFLQCVLNTVVLNTGRCCSECRSEGCWDCSLLRLPLGGCCAGVVGSHVALSGVGCSLMSTVISATSALKAIRMLPAEKLFPGAAHVLAPGPSQHGSSCSPGLLLILSFEKPLILTDAGANAISRAGACVSF